MNKPNLEQTVALMTAEILRDMACGIAPLTAASFGELHDYVDANCYGNFEALHDSFDAENPAAREALWQFMNDAQTAVDRWLRERVA